MPNPSGKVYKGDTEASGNLTHNEDLHTTLDKENSESLREYYAKGFVGDEYRYARVPLKGIPNPSGNVYKGENEKDDNEM